MCDSSSELRLREAQNDGALGAKPPYRFEENARQPKRAGTWQFMSVACVNSQCTRPVTVADELEAFFHVFLFWAVRCVPHTIRNTEGFIADYFHTFCTSNDGKLECSWLKDLFMHSGRFTSRVSLRFLKTERDPEASLNVFINTILEPFKARYEILDYERSIEHTPSENKPTSASDSPSTRMPPFPPLKRNRMNSRHVHGATLQLQSIKLGRAPTEKTTRLAEQLDSHDWVLSLFEEVHRAYFTPFDAAWDDLGVHD